MKPGRYSGDKDIAVICSELVAAGWMFVKGKNHNKLQPPGTAMRLPIPGTPSGGCRSYKNFKAQIKRVQKALSEPRP